MNIPPERKLPDVQQQFSELARCSLIQVGDLRELEQKLKEIVERSSKNTRSALELAEAKAIAVTMSGAHRR